MYARAALERQCFKYCIAETRTRARLSGRAEGRGTGRRGNAESMHPREHTYHLRSFCSRAPRFTALSRFSRSFVTTCPLFARPASSSRREDARLFFLSSALPLPGASQSAEKYCTTARERSRILSSLLKGSYFVSCSPFRPPIGSTYQIFYSKDAANGGFRLHVKYIDREVELYKKGESAYSGGRMVCVSVRKV